uniref:DDB1- and CUL4-associated factor 11 n=2 Tax=Timema TaxID=61471 RepID=A0A7R9H7Y0_TIMPO|nr:unnamed protein product [Timema poppensis]
MGTSTSRGADERSDESSDQDSDLGNILQYLIRSGQVHIISAEQDLDSDNDEFVAAASPPRVVRKPNTKILDRSEVSLLTRQACGLMEQDGHDQPTSLSAMISARERGMNGKCRFSRADCCKISNFYLPDGVEMVENYRSKAFCGSYSKDGNLFLSACQDRNLRVYDTEHGKFDLLKVIQARDVGWSILDTAISPDGNYVVYSSWSECLHLCRVHGDNDLQDTLSLCPDERRFCIFSLTFSSDGREILGGANDGHLYVYDRECNQRALRIEGHDDDVNTVAFADETSQIFYSGGDDGLCKVWDRRTLCESNAKPVGILAGHMDGVTHIDSRGDGRHLLSNSKDQSIKLWDIRVFSGVQAQHNTKKSCADQTWDYRWQKVPKKMINPRKNLDGDTSIMTYRGHKVLQTLIRCHFSPEFTTGQRFIYTGCAAGRVVIYDMLTGKVKAALPGHSACVRDVSWHPYRTEIISSGWDGMLGRWTYTGKKVYDYVPSGAPMETNPPSDQSEPTSPVTLRRSRRIAQQQQQQTQQQQPQSTARRRDGPSKKTTRC